MASKGVSLVNNASVQVYVWPVRGVSLINNASVQVCMASKGCLPYK